MLPPDIAKAIEDYESRIASGELTFDGKFAHKPDSVPDIEMAFIASKLPSMDITRP